MQSINTEIETRSESSFDTDLNLEHIRAELARIDILICQAVQRWQLAGQDPLDAFRGFYVSDAEAVALMDRPLCSNWEQMGTLPDDDETAYRHAIDRAGLQVREITEAASNQGNQTCLDHLVETFELDEFELDTLLICMAPTLDLRYEKLYGYLQDDITRKRPGINLVLDLLCPPGPERLQKLAHFSDHAPLFRHHLLERSTEPGQPKAPLLSQSLVVDETIVHWLLGTYQPQGELAFHLSLTSPDLNQENEILAGVASKLLEQPNGKACQFVFYGADQLGQEAAACLLAACSNRSLLTLDLSAVSENEIPSLKAINITLRDARLLGAIPFLKDWDACLVDGVPPSEILTTISEFPGMLIIGGESAWQPRGVERSVPMVRNEFPIPDSSHRFELWKHFLKGLEDQDSIEIKSLASQFTLTASQIRDAVAYAKDDLSSCDEPLTMEGLLAGARASSTPRLASLARKISPHYTWDDIVLPDDRMEQLREICNMVKFRALVLERWGFGSKLSLGKGVNVLFAGPSGTGKTMAAEVMANELGLDLYKIDLATVVSKYIGETEKNLARIFAEAESSNAILFFDEADALFGKRSEVRDAHDRYANIEISYLLQKMEEYEGLTILATNLRKNLDEAFVRRMQFMVVFPFPDEASRLQIWERIWPAQTPRSPELDLATLARKYEVTGGNIRNIALAATFLAASDGKVVGMHHVLRATRREYQKMGKVAVNCDFEERE